MRFEAKGLCYAYPGQPGSKGPKGPADAALAVREVSFEISGGERLAIAGRNGAGKSTLARLCCGLISPCAGSACVDGRDLAGLAPKVRARLSGYVFQDPSAQLFAATVREEIAYGPRNIGLSDKETDEAVEKAAAMTGLSDHLETNPFELGLSKRRMTALASLLSIGPELLFLDEPTAGLDLPARRLLEDVLDMLRKEGTAVAVISHDMDFCAALMDRILVMDQGGLAADETTRAFFADEKRARALGLSQPEAARLGFLTGLTQTPRDAADFLRLFAAAREQGAGRAERAK